MATLQMRDEYVRVTYYTLRGTTYYGASTELGVAACSWNFDRATSLRFSDSRTVRCLDRGLGDLYWDGWIDVWVPDQTYGRLNITQTYGDYTWVEVVEDD
jgi:hypothetical protein